MNDPRCLLADDHPALTVAIEAYLSDNGFEIIGPAPDGRRAVLLATEHQPELALIDYRMPRLAGTDLVRAIREASPGTRIAVYTAEADEQLAADVLEAGAVALVLKEAPLADLVRALEAALAGGSYIDPALVEGRGAEQDADRRASSTSSVCSPRGCSTRRSAAGSESARRPCEPTCVRRATDSMPLRGPRPSQQH